MLYGAGNLIFETSGLTSENSLRGQDLLYPGLFSSFELTSDTGFLEAKALVAGKLQTVASGVNAETWTLKVTTQFIDWTAMQFGLDELSSNTSGAVVPLLKTATVPATGAAEVTDLAVTALTEPGIKVYIANKGDWGDRLFLTKVGVAPANGTEVQVDTTNNKLIFHSSLAGATVQYVVGVTYSSIQTIGVASQADSFGSLKFSGKLFGTEFGNGAYIIVPKLARVSTPALSVAGDVTELTMEFRALVPEGARKPYQLYNLDTAVV
jgi:hypothetical protein